MVVTERLQDAFEQLGWSRIPDILHIHAEDAAKHNRTYLEFLDALLQEELSAKHDRFIRMKTRMAHLPYHKTLDQFDFSYQPSIEERRIRDLATFSAPIRKKTRLAMQNDLPPVGPLGALNSAFMGKFRVQLLGNFRLQLTPVRN